MYRVKAIRPVVSAARIGVVLLVMVATVVCAPGIATVIVSMVVMSARALPVVLGMRPVGVMLPVPVVELSI